MAVQDSETCELPAVAVNPLGAGGAAPAPGGAFGIADIWAEGADSPVAFTAATI
jgi:hypothetical protein